MISLATPWRKYSWRFSNAFAKSLSTERFHLCKHGAAIRLCSRMADEPRLEAGAHLFEKGGDKAPELRATQMDHVRFTEGRRERNRDRLERSQQSANRDADSDRLVSLLR